MLRAISLSLLLAAACTETDEAACPGEVVATFTFSGAKVSAGDPALDGLDPAPAVPDCPPEVGYGATLTPFPATLAADASTQAAALCRGRGVVLFGLRSGSRYVVETATGGAVLGACSPSCSAELRLVVAGDVVADAGGQPASFQGALVEVMKHVDGDCGGCLPEPTRSCAGRFAIAGTR